MSRFYVPFRWRPTPDHAAEEHRRLPFALFGPIGEDERVRGLHPPWAGGGPSSAT